MIWRLRRVGPFIAAATIISQKDKLKGLPGEGSWLKGQINGCDNDNLKYEERLETSITKVIDHCEKVQRRMGLPGLSVAVAVNGNVVFEKGFGYADLENSLPMRPDTVMRIASISKSITMAMLAEQMEKGKVDIDCPIQKYIPDFPKKTWEGKEVEITTRHLLSHLSGIRHYRKKEEIEKKKEEATNDSDYKEFFYQLPCESVAQAMELFKNDELIHKPGTKYFYTTHGWTVVSAVVEKAVGTAFEKHCKRMFQYWGMQNTYLDEHDPIIVNRARYYRWNDKKSLINAPWVNNSCKWAGGGFLSTAQDLIRFAHIMLYSAQQPQKGSNTGPKAFLKRETIRDLWAGEKGTALPYMENLYGLGWVVGEPFSNCFGCNARTEKFVAHSGGAVGASSILLIQLPNPDGADKEEGKNETPGQVKGVVVAMITNLQDVGLTTTAKKISQEFSWMMDMDS